MGEIPRLAISHAWFLTGVTGASGPVWNCPFLQENCLVKLKFSYMVSGSHESEKNFEVIEGLEVTTLLFLVYSTTQRELKNSQDSEERDLYSCLRRGTLGTHVCRQSMASRSSRTQQMCLSVPTFLPPHSVHRSLTAYSPPL